LDEAKAQIAALPKADRTIILEFLYERLTRGNPRRIGRPLLDPFGGFWRYRVADYRIICALEEARLIVLVVRVGHRREVYRAQ
jgi:mRNA interferase RelE/StbE